MNAIDIKNAKTAELVEWFNANTSGNPVKKFADRETAERRCQAILDAARLDEPKDANRSAAIAETWKDPDVAAARARRDHVTADGVEYPSVKQAFIDLELDLRTHIKFRGELKAAGKLVDRNGIEWAIVKK